MGDNPIHTVEATEFDSSSSPVSSLISVINLAPIHTADLS